MKFQMKWFVIACVALVPAGALALSRSIERDIEFPKDYDKAKAEAIRKVVRDERFKFVDGTVSYWAPDWATRLSYEGEAASLNEFLGELRAIRRISLRLVLYRGRNDEQRRDTSWQIDFSRARPDQLTLYLNINSPTLDFSKVQFPEWAAK